MKPGPGASRGAATDPEDSQFGSEDSQQESGSPGASALRRVPALWAGTRRRQLALLFCNSLAQAVLIVLAALLARALVDGHWPYAMVAGIVLLVSLLLGVALLRRTQIVQAESVAQHYITAVRMALFDALSSLSSAGRQKRSRGAVMLRFVGDAQALRVWAGFGVPGLAAAAVAWLALVGGLAILDGALALIGLVWACVAAVGMFATLPQLVRRVREARLCQAYLAANVHDKIGTLAVMQSAAQGGRERRRLQRQNERLAKAMQQRAVAQGRYHLALDLALVGLALSIVGLLVMEGKALHTLQWPGADGLAGAVGSNGTLLGALGLVGMLSAPLRRIGRALEQRAAALVARDRIAEFLVDAEVLPPATTQPLPREPVLQLAGLPLGAGSPQALAATVLPGRRIAVVGPQGCGKTTLLETLARLRPLTTGEVMLGGQMLGHIGIREFGRRVSYLSPESPPLRGTLRRNLGYRRSSAQLEELQVAAGTAGWPGPLDATVLNRRVRDGGANLGGQERRALTLARALVGRPALLLIDDIEHCLPAPTRQALERLLEGHEGTLIFSTHEPALAAMAHEVWELAPGAVAAGKVPVLQVVGTTAGVA